MFHSSVNLDPLDKEPEQTRVFGQAEIDGASRVAQVIVF